MALLKYQPALVAGAYLTLFTLSRSWLALVTHYVPKPYLDEVFHVPQAQRYCLGDYGWDPKITTPPGLYLISLLFSKTPGSSCSTLQLRTVNVMALLLTMKTSMDIQTILRPRSDTISPHALHTAANIALFPLIFFFSGLYYTDVMSTCLVLLSYKHFLKQSSGFPSIFSSLQTVLYGVAALLMRQTNIFWVAVLPAALAWRRSCNAMNSKPFARWAASSEPALPWAKSMLVFYARRNIHDLPLHEASIVDFATCAVSLAVAALANPIRFLRITSPYLFLLMIFASFVLWNGSVVLGDKSNHIATLHLPQLLYLCPFIAGLSLPLLMPHIRDLFGDVMSFVIRPAGLRSRTSLRYMAWMSLSMMTAVATVHYNTIIHPFTLADNRHYTFYAFRYTIRWHESVKYLLVPIYLVAGLLIYRTLAGFANPIRDPKSVSGEVKLASSSQQSDDQPSQLDERPPQPKEQSTLSIPYKPTASFFILYIFATALSLVTAPLVEPRYFILPWVLWRLHMPDLPRGTGKRLWWETGWYLIVNTLTGYVFLFCGFEWASETGNVQRFMW